jgi:tripartite-type tricarboxylate transporter receptor subunit TctC
MKKILPILLSVVITATASAEPIQVISPYGAGGNGATVTQILNDSLNDKKILSEAKIFNNCVLAKTTWDNSTKAIMFRDALFAAPAFRNCDIETTEDNFVMMLHVTPFFLCNTGPEGKTTEDLTKKGTKYIIGDSSASPTEQMVSHINKVSNTNSKVVHFDFNYSVVAAAAKSGEVDFLIANGTWPETQLGAKCLWSTGTVKVGEYPLAKDIWPDNRSFLSSAFSWFIAKGFTKDELSELRKVTADTWLNNSDWKALRKKRGWDDAMVPKSVNESVDKIRTEYSIWNESYK